MPQAAHAAKRHLLVQQPHHRPSVCPPSSRSKILGQPLNCSSTPRAPPNLLLKILQRPKPSIPFNDHNQLHFALPTEHIKYCSLVAAANSGFILFSPPVSTSCYITPSHSKLTYLPLLRLTHKHLLAKHYALPIFSNLNH
ncbi:hypothetical protein M758_UG251600 [Ceratodon purpureus]|nr:hypothetical protein M758_UG251600 [Ceratodon purpureus]